jgi:DNA-binding CsgD family transcriptional regulator
VAKPKIELQIAALQAEKLKQQLENEMEWLLAGNLRNAYSPVAWVRLNREFLTILRGMQCMRLRIQGKSPAEIQAETGLSRQTIAAYTAWNTMYGRAIDRHLAARGRTKKQKQSDRQFLNDCGVTL